eukprot:m.93091 g.93091  ORF g.93091 m.93091 type:complete len:535 (-) comp8529_c0_seq3:40-1644(-)
MICSNVINFTVWHQACPHSPNQTHASGDLSSRKGNPTGLPMRELSSTTLALVPRVQADRSAHGSLLSHQAMLAELRRDKSSRDGGALCVPVRSNSNRLSPSVPPSFGLHSAMHRSVRSLRLFSSLARCPRVLATTAVHMPSVSGPTQRIVVPSARQLHWSAVMRSDINVVFASSAESIHEGTVFEIQKGEGSVVAQDEVIMTIETDKEVTKVTAPKSGKVGKILVEPGSTVKIGATLFSITPGEGPAPAAAAPKAAAAAAPAPAAAPAAPKAAAPEAPKAAPAPAPAAKPAAKDAPAPAAIAGSRGETRVKMTRMRSRTAERLKDSQNTAAMLTTFNEVDMSNLMDFRKKYKDDVQKNKNIKLGFMSAFVKASVHALKDQPVVNAYIQGEDIVYHDFIDISVAVASPRGLVVPVIRNAENLSFLEVEKYLADLSAKARNNEISLEDMTGGTFTISNGGVFGSLMGTPILNPPQAAILGMHAVNDRPVAINGQVVIRPMMYLALTYDHRLIDGREAVTFLRKIKEAIEDPRVLLL